MADLLPSTARSLLARTARAQREGRVPSLLTGVVRDGELAWSCGRGAVAEPHADVQYRLGSITKTVTAVAVMQLRDEGRLDLADPLERHIPEAPYGDRSIRSLLSHSSGMTAEPAGPWWERTHGVSWDELVTANASARTVVAPGSRYHYSNLAFALLGELVGRLRGSGWHEAVMDKVLGPLGLDATTYQPSYDAAQGTSRDPVTGMLMAEPATDTVAMAPAGQLWSTIQDLARWGDFLVTGHRQVLSASSLTEMRTVQSADPGEQHVGGYGLGLRLLWLPTGSLVGHTGSMPGFLAGLFVDSRTRVGAVMLTNATTGVNPETVLLDLVKAAAATGVAVFDTHAADVALDELAAPTESAAEAEELRGNWYWGNTAMTLVPARAGFFLRSAGTDLAFDCIDPDRYRGRNGYFTGEDLHVVRRDDGAVSHLEVVTFILTRRPYDPAAPIPGGIPAPVSWPG
jgi:CubicO group peptidase (beta-lactamase class C family)